jgi:small subunit ribosomal protein S16
LLKIRLRRQGSRNHPFYRVVVSESRRTPKGRATEILGYYDPKREPPQVKIDLDRYEHWVGTGAQPSDTVRSLVKRLHEQPAAAGGAEEPGA